MTNKLNIYRSGVIVTSFDIDESTVFNEKLNGTKTITCVVNSVIALDLQKEDYIIYKGEKFTINVNPEAAKEGTSLTKSYNMVFEPDQATMLDIFVDKNGVKTFPYYGTAADQLRLLTDSMGAGWSVSEVESTEEKNLDYDWTYVRSALDQIATAFELECQVTGKSIKMVKSIGRDTGLMFRYGRGKGLHQIKRAADTSKSSVNRVYGIGGTKNIPATYRGGVQTNLIFEERFVETAGVSAGTVRIKEVKYVNEDIYPRFLGTVISTTVNKNTTGEITSCTITDPAIDFNINDHLQAGVKAKVSFLTGPLAGVDFEISGYNATTKTTTLINTTDANGYILPNNLNYPGIGDKFTYLEMNMPEAYVVRAENDLKAKTQQYLAENTPDRSIFDVKPDEKHLRDNQIYLQVGDRVKISDIELQADEILRFTEISYPLVNEFNVTGVVGNEVKYDIVEKLFANVLQAQQQIQVINRTNIENARRNSRNLIELKDAVVDPEGNYYTELIKPRSIESLYLSIGAVATNFNLNNVSFSPNALGNPNSFTATAGQLIHYDLEIEGSGYIWEMQPFSITNLIATNQYFLYAKISKVTLVGSWELSTEVKLAESLPGFYILQAGVLFPVKEGRRDNQLTKGMVFIVGDQITAGRMKSIDGSMFMDLTTGQLKLTGAKSSFDFNVSRPGEVTLAGAFFQSGSGIVSPIPTYRGGYVSGVSYYKGDTVSYLGSSWIYINDIPGSGHTPADDAYWDLFSAEGSKGDDGANGNYTEFIFQKNGSTMVPPSLNVSATNPVGWSNVQPVTATSEYLWMSSALKSGVTGSLINAWSAPVRTNSRDGDTGKPGPALSFAGAYDPNRNYTGSSVRIEAVEYLGKFYFSKTDVGVFSGKLPTDIGYWNPPGGQFDSIATGLLLAEAATIENLIVRNVKTTQSGERIEIRESDNTLTFYDKSEQNLLQLKGNVDTFYDDDPKHTTQDLAGLEFRRYYQSNPSNPDIIKVTGNGLYANTSGVSAALGPLGYEGMALGSIIGYVRRAVTLDAEDIHSAIVGLSAITDASGGYFKHLSSEGVALRVDGKIQTMNADQNLRTGISARLAYSLGNSVYHLTFVNGILVERGSGA